MTKRQSESNEGWQNHLTHQEICPKNRSHPSVRDLRIFEHAVELETPRVRVACPHCGPKRELRGWLDPYARVTKRLAESVSRLCAVMSIRHVADYFGLNGKTVKNIDKRSLERRLGPVDLKGVTVIGMDEFAIQRSHRYAMVVIEPARKRVLWVGRERSREGIRPFFTLLGPEGCAALEAGVPRDLVELGLWVAREYCSTPARGLELVLPPGTQTARGQTAARTETVAVATVGATAALEAGSSGLGPGYSAPASFAYLGTRYFHEYGIPPEEGKRMLAKIAVKNHHNGSLNPKAHFQNELTIEQVVNAPIVAWPLGLYDCCGVSDGASVAVVTRADMAKSFRDDPIYIKSMQICTGARQGAMRQDYDFVNMDENGIGSGRAYEEAGVKDPRKEISIAEVHDCVSVHEMIVYEDLRFTKRGGAREDITAGAFQLGGGLPAHTGRRVQCFADPPRGGGESRVFVM